MSVKVPGRLSLENGKTRGQQSAAILGGMYTACTGTGGGTFGGGASAGTKAISAP